MLHCILISVLIIQLGFSFKSLIFPLFIFTKEAELLYLQVCKYFLDAVEKKRYGWFWERPKSNGGNVCHYRHVLFAGYVLKLKALLKKGTEKISVEEGIENQVQFHELVLLKLPFSILIVHNRLFLAASVLRSISLIPHLQ